MAGLCGTCVLAALAFFAMRGTWDMYGKLREASASAAAAGSELVSLETEETQINADITRLSSARGIEGELRERYGFAKPGEGVIQVVDRQSEDTAADAAPKEPQGFGVLKMLFPW